jgi:HEPN domain-containing protein
LTNRKIAGLSPFGGWYKRKGDVVRGRLRKAANDMVTLEAALAAGAFDGACFHAQQAAEKYLKGFLAFHEKPFPYTQTTP